MSTTNAILGPVASLDEVLLLPPLEWCVEGLLPRNGLLLFSGRPKLGKTVTILDMVLRGVQRRQAFSRFKQVYGKVLLINLEGGARGVKMRERMFKDERHDVLQAVHISGQKFHITMPSGVTNPEVIGRLIEAFKPYDLVALDPLVSFNSGDENNSQQMVALLDALRLIAEAADVSFIIVHHNRKLGSQQTLKDAKDSGGDMLRGASGIFGAVDGVMLLWNHLNGRRSITFIPRYGEEFADEVFDEVVLAQDRITRRLYPLVGTGGLQVPDPHEWVLDCGVDWSRYGVAFGLAGDAVDAAKRLLPCP